MEAARETSRPAQLFATGRVSPEEQAIDPSAEEQQTSDPAIGPLMVSVLEEVRVTLGAATVRVARLDAVEAREPLIEAVRARALDPVTA
jgi:hypothetical protein